MLKFLAASVLLAFFCLPASAQTVATCPTATAGTAWASSWLPCPAGVVYVSLPLPASAIVSDLRGSAASWVLASSVPATDQVWAKTPAVPAGQWILATAQLASTSSTPPPSPPATYDAQAVVSWTAPPAFTDGTPINVPLTYNVYRGTAAAALTKLTNVSALTYTDPAGSSTPTTYYYAISATCASCTESAESSVVSKTIAAPALKPGAPAAAIH